MSRVAACTPAFFAAASALPPYFITRAARRAGARATDFEAELAEAQRARSEAEAPRDLARAQMRAPSWARRRGAGLVEELHGGAFQDAGADRLLDLLAHLLHLLRRNLVLLLGVQLLPPLRRRALPLRLAVVVEQRRVGPAQVRLEQFVLADQGLIDGFVRSDDPIMIS